MLKGQFVEIRFGEVGVILSGDHQGWQVKILDDTESTGGYLICTSPNFADSTSEAFDDWVEDYDSLKGYFVESNWRIDWS